MAKAKPITRKRRIAPQRNLSVGGRAVASGSAADRSSVSWEEQKQLEKALMASLKSQSSVEHKRATKPRGYAEFDPTHRAVRKSACTQPLFLDKKISGRPISMEISRPLASRTYPQTDDFIRYLCFKDTGFLPPELEVFNDLPVERFSCRSSKQKQKRILKISRHQPQPTTQLKGDEKLILNKKETTPSKPLGVSKRGERSSVSGDSSRPGSSRTSVDQELGRGKHSPARVSRRLSKTKP